MKILPVLFALLFFAGCNTDENEKVVYRDSASASITPKIHSQVTTEYGALTVKEGEFTGTTKITPWSSWWFPTKDKLLFELADRNEMATLQKYDSYVEKSIGDDPETARFEELEIYEPSEVNWAGLCHAWAVASVLHVEPRSPVIRKGIQFNVGDQKALLLKSYENVGDLKIFGSRFNGSFDDEFNDVYPDQFHRFAQVHLFERNLPFMMDYDPSFPVWTVPVNNIKFKITRIDDTSAHVKAWVTIASPFVDSPNFVGTKKSVKAYEYHLIGRWVGDSLKVTGSEWINDSSYDHPDFLIAYPDSVKRASLNTKLEMEMINEIVGLKYVDHK